MQSSVAGYDGLIGQLAAVSIEPVFVKNPQGVLDAARTAFETGFTARLNRITHWLYQRSAVEGYVEVTHKVWAGQLKQLDKELSDTSIKVEEACRFLLVKGRPSERSNALASLLYIETVATVLKKKSEKLQLILESKSYAQALEYFKAKVTECSAIATKLKVEERVQALFCMLTDVDAKRAGIKDVLGNEPAVIVEEATCVYEDAVKFAAYTGRFFSLEVLASPDVRDKIQEVQERLGGGQLLEAPQLAELPLLPKNKLPTENYFRNGQWFATWSYIGYGPIASIIYPLQNIAVALYEEELTLEKSLKQICKGENVELDLATINTLEQLVCQQLVLLQDMAPPSQIVHAGWNYAAGLFAHVKSIRTTREQLELMRKGEFSLQVAALQKVVQFLQVKEGSLYSGRQAQLTCLSEACAAFKAMDVSLENRFYKLLKDLFWDEARSTVEYSAEERTYSSMIRSEEAVWSFAPGVFQTYLMAGFLRQVYFGGVDQNFYAVLTKLREDPANSEGFKACLEGSKECKELYEAFLASTYTFIQ